MYVWNLAAFMCCVVSHAFKLLKKKKKKKKTLWALHRLFYQGNTGIYGIGLAIFN